MYKPLYFCLAVSWIYLGLFIRVGFAIFLISLDSKFLIVFRLNKTNPYAWNLLLENFGPIYGYRYKLIGMGGDSYFHLLYKICVSWRSSGP